MKKSIAILLTLLLLTTALSPSFAEETETPFIVGATTPVSGMFFTNMWGNNTSDIDVRTLLHAYSPVEWTAQSRFEGNPMVVAEITPGEIADGNKIYVIELQPDLKYNDGTQITAEDYVFSLMLHASPLINALGGITTNSGYIAGSEDYVSGASDVFTGLRLISDTRFSIEIDAAYLPFFYELSMLDCLPYPMAVIAPGCEVFDTGDGVRIQDIGGGDTLFTEALLQETIMNPETGYLKRPMVTSGPYQLETYDEENHIVTFSINPNFKGDFNGATPSIEPLVLQPVEPDTMIDDLENGVVQLLNKVVEGETITRGLNLADFRSMSYARLGFGFITFACEQGPMQFEVVRKAVGYAMDTEAFIDGYNSNNYAIPVYGYYGVGQWMVTMARTEGAKPDGVNDDEIERWAAFSLEGLNTYAMNLETAKQLLIDDGWTLNAQGAPFAEGTDTVRYKMVDGALMGLNLKYGKMENSNAAQLIEDLLTEPLASIGVALDVTVVPFTELIEHYYRQQDRTYDMMYLATNFISVFDPYFVFNTDPAYDGPQNTTGFRDEQLEQLAWELRQTEPGDLLTYCERWLAFQTYWNEKLPMLPLYSNMYADFFVPELQDYNPNSDKNWPAAIVPAYLGDPSEQSFLTLGQPADPDETDGDLVTIP